MSKPLEEEYDYYLDIREELALENNGKYVAIKGQEVLGIYDDYMAAASAVYVEHQYGTVLMQEIGRDCEFFTGFFRNPEIEAH